MRSLIFDEGYKEFDINGDKNRVIRFRPADISLLERAEAAINNIQQAIDTTEDIKLKANGEPVDELKADADVIRKTNKIIYENINYIFAEEVSETVFGKHSPLMIVKDGLTLVEAFLETVMPEIQREMNIAQDASNKRKNKYVQTVKQNQKQISRQHNKNYSGRKHN